MKDQDIHEYLTAVEFAERARVGLRAVRKWADKGVGPEPVRPAGTRIVRYRAREVEEWLNGESTAAGMGR